MSEPNKGFPLKDQLTINLYYNFFRGMLLTEVISAIIKVKYRNLFDYLLRQFKQTEFFLSFLPHLISHCHYKLLAKYFSPPLPTSSKKIRHDFVVNIK